MHQRSEESRIEADGRKGRPLGQHGHRIVTVQAFLMACHHPEIAHPRIGEQARGEDPHRILDEDRMRGVEFRKGLLVLALHHHLGLGRHRGAGDVDQILEPERRARLDSDRDPRHRALRMRRRQPAAVAARVLAQFKRTGAGRGIDIVEMDRLQPASALVGHLERDVVILPARQARAQALDPHRVGKAHHQPGVETVEVVLVAVERRRHYLEGELALGMAIEGADDPAHVDALLLGIEADRAGDRGLERDLAGRVVGARAQPVADRQAEVRDPDMGDRRMRPGDQRGRAVLQVGHAVLVGGIRAEPGVIAAHQIGIVRERMARQQPRDRRVEPGDFDRIGALGPGPQRGQRGLRGLGVGAVAALVLVHLSLRSVAAPDHMGRGPRKSKEDSGRIQRGADVRDQIGGVLDPHRDPHETRRDADRGAVFRAQVLVRRGRGMGRDRLRIAEVVGDRDDLQRVEEAEGRVLAAGEIEAQHRAARPHLLHRKGVLRMVGEPRIDGARKLRMPRHRRGHRHRIRRLRPHPQVQRLQTREQDPGVERAHRAAGMLDVGLERAADELARAKDDAAQHPAAAVDVLGRGIDDDIGAKRHRTREDRRGEGIVHHHHGADGMGDPGHALDVDHLEPGVRHALEEAHLGVGPHRGAPVRQIGAVDQRHLDAEGREHLEHMQAGAEHLPRRDDMVARCHQRHQRAVDRGHPRGAGKTVLGALDRRHPVLEHPRRRVAVAGIDELVRARGDEARLGDLGRGIDEALGQEQRLGHLAVLRAADAVMHEFRPGVPVFRHGPSPEKVTRPNAAGRARQPAAAAGGSNSVMYSRV
ncbi:hypothetical protein SDC9_30401 [bioreactor metagenome]|uniref:Uncharacterized protein n=1 Tax=bioreactor metagenome TaxID=1076179 RepID=A0A644UZD5_9ZZZZ